MIFDETKHPRDDEGKFTQKGGFRQNAGYDEIIAADKEADTYYASDEEEGRVQTPDEIDALYGEEFTGYKGQAAVDKLLKEKHGHVKAAFHREDMGDIDLLWGNDYLGLQHIIKHREEQGINAIEFMKDLAEVVEKGKFYKMGNNGTFEFWYNGKSVVISPEYHKHKVTYLLTAYKKKLSKKREPQ